MGVRYCSVISFVEHAFSFKCRRADIYSRTCVITGVSRLRKLAATWRLIEDGRLILGRYVRA